MTYSTSMLKVDGVWRNLLIVSSEKEQFFTQRDIANTFTDENANEVSIIYYTEGVYRHKVQDNMHFYWFLYNSTRTTVNGVPNDEHLQALEVLGVEV